MIIKQLTLTTLALILCHSVALAQTKLIAHKSHSGSNKSFSLALKADKFGAKFSNFGAAPRPRVTTARLDSIVFLEANVAVMYTSKYCKILRRSSDKTNESKFWRPGKAVLKNHALFNRNNSLAHIKRVLKEKYHFKNSIDEVKFINHTPTNKMSPTSPNPKGKQPNQKKSQQKQPLKNNSSKKKNNALPSVKIDRPSPPNHQFMIVTLIFLAGMVSLFGGIFWKLNSTKTSKV